MSTKEILREKVGVCRQYVKIFSEMCMIADLSVKNIRGYSKAYTYLPGKKIKFQSITEYIKHKQIYKIIRSSRSNTRSLIKL